MKLILAALAAAVLAVTLTALVPARASASTTPTRLAALEFAEHQAGKWYCWGGTGPSCYDCSGLVMAAYAHAGVRLPRTTFEMLDSRILRRIPASQRRRGDLAFYGARSARCIPGPASAGIARHPGGIPRCTSGSYEALPGTRYLKVIKTITGLLDARLPWEMLRSRCGSG